MVTQSVSSTNSSCDSLQIGFCQILNGGLHLDCEALQWLKSVDIWGAQNEKKKQPPPERLYFTCGQLQRNSPRN